MKKLCVFICFMLASISLFAQLNLNSKGVALSGYDPVSYFQEKAVEGNEKYQVKFKSATYYFSSEKNKKTFISSPSKFLPCYGGYCAYAMGAGGYLYDVDPETYKIIDDKLFLFYNSYLNNTKTKWDKDEKNLKSNADKNWVEKFNK